MEGGVGVAADVREGTLAGVGAWGETVDVEKWISWESVGGGREGCLGVAEDYIVVLLVAGTILPCMVRGCARRAFGINSNQVDPNHKLRGEKRTKSIILPTVGEVL